MAYPPLRMPPQPPASARKDKPDSDEAFYKRMADAEKAEREASRHDAHAEGQVAGRKVAEAHVPEEEAPRFGR